MKKISLYFALILFLFGCKKETELSSEVFNSEAFQNITIKNSFEVELIESAEFKLEISSENKNNIDKVDFQIVNNELVISDQRNLKFLNPNEHIYIKIYSAEFFKITLNGGVSLSNKGELTSTEIGVIFNDDYNFCDLKLNNNVFYFWNELESGGDLKLTGTTNTVKFWFSGLVNIDSQNTIAKEAIVYSNSRVDTKLYASEKIECEIMGEGNIVLFGNPATVIDNSINSQNTGKLLIQ